MKKRRIIIIICVTAIITAIVIPKLIPDKNGLQANPQAQNKKMPTKITVFEVQNQEVSRTLQLSGTILAEDEVELHPETQGRIVKIGFEEGSEVRKGQLLVKINDQDLQAQLKKAIASKKLKDDSEKRNRQLLEKGAISQEAYDFSQNELSAASADVDLLKENIRKTEMLAPFNGVIGLKYVSEGSYLSQTSKIASLQNIENIKIEFAVPDRYVNQLKKGALIKFATDGSHDLHEARVYAIEPKVDEMTRNVVMRARYVNADKKILPGSFAKVSLTLHSNANSIMIPTQSIVPILKGQKVFVLSGDSVIERIVKTGIRTDEQIEITDGLQIGDLVVVSGVMYLKQGGKVTVTDKINRQPE